MRKRRDLQLVRENDRTRAIKFAGRLVVEDSLVVGADCRHADVGPVPIVGILVPATSARQDDVRPVSEDGREAIAEAHDGAHVQLRCDVSDSVVDVAVRRSPASDRHTGDFLDRLLGEVQLGKDLLVGQAGHVCQFRSEVSGCTL